MNVLAPISEDDVPLQTGGAFHFHNPDHPCDCHECQPRDRPGAAIPSGSSHSSALGGESIQATVQSGAPGAAMPFQAFAAFHGGPEKPWAKPLAKPLAKPPGGAFGAFQAEELQGLPPT